MRILIFSPHAVSRVTGNTVTLGRLQENLTKSGHKVQIVTPASEDRTDLIQEAIDTFRPDVLHWYHGYKTGRHLLNVTTSVPSVVTMAGTDLNEDSDDEDRREIVRQVCDRAKWILVASGSLEVRLQELFPEFRHKIRRVAKGVELGEEPFDLGIEDKHQLVLLPGGIRRVKNNVFALRAIDPLVREFPELRFVMAGPVIDEDYGRLVKREIEKREWASYIGVIPHASMGFAYARAEVVLNTSKSEGLSNTLIEAMWCGAVVLASDIAGNRTAVRDRVTGFLYKDQLDFRETLRGLLQYPNKMGIAAKELARDHYSSERETADHLQIYNDLA